jgi:hypothetical protein
MNDTTETQDETPPTSEEFQVSQPGNINPEVLQNISVTLSIEVGRTNIKIKDLMRLTQGSVVELDRIAGEKVQRLRERRADFLAGAHVFAGGASEGAQEVVGLLGVCDFHGAHSLGHSNVFGGIARSVRDGVQKNFGAHAADRRLREVFGIQFIRLVRAG